MIKRDLLKIDLQTILKSYTLSLIHLQTLQTLINSPNILTA